MPSCAGSNSNQIQVSTAASVKIVNGDDADIEDHPWMVSFQIRKSGGNYAHECGGAIIDKSWVLTAAHCNLFRHEAKNMRIAAGSSFLSQMTENIPVKKFYLQDKYNSDTGLQNDLMLLQLQKPLKFGSTINKIDLDTNVGHNYTGEVCTITGWGKTDAKGKNNPARLQVQYMPVVTNAHCNSTWFLFTKYSLYHGAYSNFICLQDNDKDSCQGDSGGPLVCSNMLVGALSFGAPTCNGSLPSVHTKISPYLDWIKDKINTKNNKNKKDKKKKKNDNKGKLDGKGKSEGKGKVKGKGKGKKN
ncbi:CTRB [Mytilus edulis]|uniref:CTRB n=1 Tax=Mytilus edulis TaxID=6550 RepID=A0A8S3UJN9_MYTED|nr:CTRB [Mytilus edulis]